MSSLTHTLDQQTRFHSRAGPIHFISRSRLCVCVCENPRDSREINFLEIKGRLFFFYHGARTTYSEVARGRLRIFRRPSIISGNIIEASCILALLYSSLVLHVCCAVNSVGFTYASSIKKKKKRVNSRF